MPKETPLDISQPVRYEIEIDRMVIRTAKDLTSGDQYAHLVAIDKEGREHTFGYTRDDGKDYQIWVASPSSGKVGWKMNKIGD